VANWGHLRLAYPGVQSLPQKWAFNELRLVNQSPSRSTNTKMLKGRSYTHTQLSLPGTQKGKPLIILSSQKGLGQMAGWKYEVGVGW